MRVAASMSTNGIGKLSALYDPTGDGRLMLTGVNEGTA